MHAQRFVSTVGENGFVHIATDQPKGTQVEIIVVPMAEALPDASNTVAMQARGGFVNEVLGNAAEDVWNDL